MYEAQLAQVMQLKPNIFLLVNAAILHEPEVKFAFVSILPAKFR